MTDVSELWAFAVDAGRRPDADARPGERPPTWTWPSRASCRSISPATYQEPISARDALGPLGYGWTDDWQYSLSVASDGTVTVTMPSGDQRIFQPDSRRQRLLRRARRLRHPHRGHRRHVHPSGIERPDRGVQRERHARTTSRTPTATGSRPATRAAQLTSLDRHVRRVADDRLQRGRPDRVGHQLRRPDGRLYLRFRRAPDRRHELRRRGDPVHVRRRARTRRRRTRWRRSQNRRRHVPEFHVQRRPAS